MKAYIQHIKENSENYKLLQKRYNIVSLLRLFVTIVGMLSFYFYYKHNNLGYVFLAVFSCILFLLGIAIHHKISWKKKIAQMLIKINQDELNYLEKQELSFKNGAEFLEKNHLYAHDLDVFGDYSIYQHLNRTATYVGENKLANLLLNKLSLEEILKNQDAVKNLSDKINFRQRIFAFSKLAQDHKDVYNDLLKWSKNKIYNTHPLISIYSYLSPILLIGSVIFWFIFEQNIFLTLNGFLFLLNILVLVMQLKKIRQTLISADKISETLRHYSYILKEIETENFVSEKLMILQKQVTEASQNIKRLSRLLSSLDAIHNVMGAIIMNGFFLSHLHTLKSINQWKREYTSNIEKWLEVIGEFETLNSLGNFCYNNFDGTEPSSFVFPDIHNSLNLSIENMGHPFILKTERITNNISFDQQKIVILTGSNMSGKSTFLRTLGVNLILTNIGAPICATTANIHPLPICASMRLSDSLVENQSYFMAEVLRLKAIMQQLDREITFVLLDEILRGTNSEDKQEGTIVIIQKLIAKNALGVIATHDLDVCKMTKKFPDYLINKCFEAQIVNDDLVFDYRLREGTCKNKSASFLLKKEGVV